MRIRTYCKSLVPSRLLYLVLCLPDSCVCCLCTWYTCAFLFEQGGSTFIACPRTVLKVPEFQKNNYIDKNGVFLKGTCLNNFLDRPPSGAMPMGSP